MNWSARLRRRGGRLMRSPSRSCSPHQRRCWSATKPRSTPERDQRHRPGRLAADRRPVVLLGGVPEAVLAQQIGQPLARAARPGGDDDPPPLARSSARPGRASWSNTLVPGAARRSEEHRPRPAAAIDADRAVRLGERARRRTAGRRPASRPSRRWSRYSRSGGSGRYGHLAIARHRPCARRSGPRSSRAAPPAPRPPGGPG